MSYEEYDARTHYRIRLIELEVVNNNEKNNWRPDVS